MLKRFAATDSAATEQNDAKVKKALLTYSKDHPVATCVVNSQYLCLLQLRW